MMKNKKLWLVASSVILLVIIMSYIETVLQPGYLVKSIFKLLLFGGMILVYSLLSKQSVFRTVGLTRNKPSRWLVIAVLFAYFGIIAAFLILRNRIDLTSIRESLLNKEGLTRQNFWMIFGYIILVNSLLEESFFRGFITGVYKEEGCHKAGAVFSAVLFALYHLGIVVTWFDPLVLLICIAGLSAVGLFLQYIADSQKNLAASWFVHASANLAINTIGTIMLFS